MTPPITTDQIAAAVDIVLDTVHGDIVLGLPLGIGKPNPFVNALYRRIKAQGGAPNPRRLKIITALSLEKPVGKSELEQHFLAPLVERPGATPGLPRLAVLGPQALDWSRVVVSLVDERFVAPGSAGSMRMPARCGLTRSISLTSNRTWFRSIVDRSTSSGGAIGTFLVSG